MNWKILVGSRWFPCCREDITVHHQTPTRPSNRQNQCCSLVAWCMYRDLYISGLNKWTLWKSASKLTFSSDLCHLRCYLKEMNYSFICFSEKWREQASSTLFIPLISYLIPEFNCFFAYINDSSTVNIEKDTSLHVDSFNMFKLMFFACL